MNINESGAVIGLAARLLNRFLPPLKYSLIFRGCFFFSLSTHIDVINPLKLARI